MTDVVPPPVRREPERWTPPWGPALAAVGAMAVLGCAAWFFIPRGHPNEWPRLTCMNNLSQLGHLYATRMQEGRAAPPSGSAMWLSFRKSGDVRRGQEKVLLCPGDSLVRVPDCDEDESAYDAADLSHAPRALCSYAGRDFDAFPIDPKDGQSHVLGACVHHRGGALVAYDDGSVRKLTLSDLGLSSGDDLVVGPQSKSPILRQVRYGDGSVR